MVNSYCIKNVITYKVVEYSSQFYKDEEAESYDSSNENKVSNLVCHEEELHENESISMYLIPMMKKRLNIPIQVKVRTMIAYVHLLMNQMQHGNKRKMVKVNILMQVKV